MKDIGWCGDMSGSPSGPSDPPETEPDWDEIVKDAERYRWLRAQFKPRTESREWQEEISQRGNLTTYATHRTFSCFFELQDDWRFGHTELYEPALDFDKLIDELRLGQTSRSDGEKKL